jgi:hypothetical protein
VSVIATIAAFAALAIAAVSPLTAEILKQWRATTKASKVSFEDAARREISFPISFSDLPQALDALEKES